jgi:PAS domain S-box-containing protein
MAFLVIPEFAVRKVAGEALIAIVSGATAGALLLLRAGRPRASAWLFLCTLWCLLEVFVALNGGIRSTAASMLLVIFLAAACLLDLRSALTIAAVTMLISFGEAWLAYTGHPLPVYFPGNPLATWAIELGIVVLTLAVTASLLDTMRAQIAALGVSEERFRSLSDAALEGIMVHDHGVILDCNTAFARMFGYDRPDDLIGRDGPRVLLTADSQARIRLRMERREEGVLAVECVRKDGSLFSAETESRAMKHQGRDARLVAITDVTARQRAMEAQRESEAKLRENQAKLEEAQRVSRMGSYTSDIDTGHMEWSEELYRIFELDSGQNPSRDLALSRCHPDDRALLRETAAELLQTSGRFDVEYRLMMNDGRIKYVLSTGTATLDADGKPQLLGTIQDITERKHAAQEKAKLEAQLQQAQKMESIGRLAGGVAHDFNNMLTVILGYTAMCRKQAPPGSPLLRYLTEIGKAGTRSQDITQKLLGFSRRQIIAPVPSDLDALLQDLLEPMGLLIGEDIELIFEPGEGVHRVVVDHSQVNQLLLNLAANARDAMPHGGKLTIETANVTLSAEYCRTQAGAAPGKYVLLAVSDTGVGMDAETQAHIFEPFFTTKAPGIGTGLGLATVYGVVRQNGGFVNVYSEPGFGSTFKIYLPQVESETHVQAVTPAAEAIPRGSATILLVEDNDLVREMTATALESIGYQPLVAKSPQAALELCSEHGSRVHLMLSDVVMPGMNGMELRDRVWATNPGIRVLFMSGYTSNVIVRQGILKPGVNFIQKPFTVDELSRRLAETLVV